MKTIHIEQDDQGVITVAIDGGEPQPVQNAEDACQVVEATLGQPDADDTMQQEQAQQQGGFEQGFADVRGKGLGA